MCWGDHHIKTQSWLWRSLLFIVGRTLEHPNCRSLSLNLHRKPASSAELLDVWLTLIAFYQCSFLLYSLHSRCLPSQGGLEHSRSPATIAQCPGLESRAFGTSFSCSVMNIRDKHKRREELGTWTPSEDCSASKDPCWAEWKPWSIILLGEKIPHFVLCLSSIYNCWCLGAWLHF